ncbi:MAG: hypothetical protein ACXAC7_11955 [Candidatus Hodarchaeales archaeon]|jgi:hypothetical protein
MRRYLILGIFGLIGLLWLISELISSGSRGLQYDNFPQVTIPQVNPINSSSSSSSNTSFTTSTDDIRTIRGASPFVSSMVILNNIFPFFLLIMMIIVVFILFSRLQRPSPDDQTSIDESEDDNKEKEIQQKLMTLGLRLDEVILFLKMGLEQGNYKIATINGFEKLDNALADFASLSRPSHFTPLEYATTYYQAFSILNQEKLKPMVNLFYEAAYRERDPTSQELTKLIELVQNIIPEKFRDLKPTTSH